MKRARKWIITVVVLAGIAVATMAFMRGEQSDDTDTRPTVDVTRGDLVDKALAVGTIEPRVEISVKSQLSGVVKRLYVDVGDYVEAGTAIMEIKPNPTPQELVDAERRIEMRELELANIEAEYERQRQLSEKQLVSQQEFERSARTYEEARLNLQTAREQLALLREGRVTTNKGSFETVVRAPVSGFILDKMVEIGDPVVPLTSYQAGTVLMTMADMNDLLFRGTVDEIDVGRLTEQMTARVKVGALPNAEVTGRLAKIWLKARKEENSTVFPVEIEITDAVQTDPAVPEAEPTPAVLRAGYSANTEIIIEERRDVLLVPERVVTFDDDKAIVRVLKDDLTEEERVIQTGLSDAIHVEVIDGLAEGEKVLEKPPKVIE